MPLLELHNVSKSFGRLRALHSVSLRVEAGSTLALLGENGAGKSTLMKVCYGLLRPDEGEVRWDGPAVRLADPAAARRLGIGMVQQHFTLVPAMTVAENLALASPGGWRLHPREVHASARALMQRTGITVDPGPKVSDLPVGLQQRVEILMALATPTRLLILDEPTAVLSPSEVGELFAALDGIRRTGTAVILITHKLPEAMELADRVAVLRHGRLLMECPRAEVTAETLAHAMVGRSVAPPSRIEERAPGAVTLATPLLALPDEDAALVRAGETMGVAGVEGNGQAEMAETLVGLRTGPVRLEQDGALRDAGGWSVADRMAWGMAHIPEDRHATALALPAPLRENLFLAGDTMPRRGPWLDRPVARRKAAALMERFDVRAPSVDTPAVDLSGGNQQKVVVAREMSREPRLLVAMHPTRGLDVAATAFVHDAIRSHRARGGATVLVSSELDELLALSDRIRVLYRGQAVGEIVPGDADADRARLGRLMTGVSG